MVLPLVIGILMPMTYLLYSFLAPKKKIEYNEFMTKEVDRCLNNLCEIEKGWHSYGRIYTNGFVIEKKDGKDYFIKQSKLRFFVDIIFI